MTLKVAYNITDQVITLCYSGSTHMVPRDNKIATKLIEALTIKDFDSIPGLVDKSKAISTYSNGNFSIVNGEVYIGTWRAPQVLADRIIKFEEEGLPYEPLIKFGEKLKSNPSFRAVQQLFGFLSHNNMPLTEEGNFIAYKKVDKDLKDIHTRTISNAVGSVVSMPRNEVNEDPDVTCSYGLHIAAWDYAQNNYGHSSDDVMLEVEVDPADVVAIPKDYKEMKCRCCKYIVKAIVTNPNEENLLQKSCEDDCEDDGEYLDQDYRCSHCDEKDDFNPHSCCDVDDIEPETDEEDEEDEDEEDCDESDSSDVDAIEPETDSSLTSADDNDFCPNN